MVVEKEIEKAFIQFTDDIHKVYKKMNDRQAAEKFSKIVDASITGILAGSYIAGKAHKNKYKW